MKYDESSDHPLSIHIQDALMYLFIDVQVLALLAFPLCLLINTLPHHHRVSIHWLHASV